MSGQNVQPLRLLIIGINYAPEMIGIAVYTTGLAETLVARGHDVEVVTATPYYPAWRVFEGWPTRGYRVEHQIQGPNVLHCPIYVPAEPSGIRRILHHASFVLTGLLPALRRARRQRPDVVLVIAPSLLSSLTGLAAARLSGARTWLHIQDFEVEAAFATGLLQIGTRLGRAALAFERAMLSRFDRISTISDQMMARLAEKGIPAERIVELRNWADLSAVQSGPVAKDFRADFGLTTEHVAVYSGNIANKQGLDILPETARRMADRRDLTFAIFGEGSYLATLREKATGLTNIRFFPLQPRERLGELLRSADVHLLPQLAGAADLVLPSKLTNMLASGRPVLATADPETALAREIGPAGLVTPPGDAGALAEALRTILDDPDRRADMGLEARRRAEARWSQARIIDGFETHLRQLLGQNERGLHSSMERKTA